jgi:hypothetical protein
MHHTFPLLSSVFINEIFQRLPWLADQSIIPMLRRPSSSSKPCMEQLPPVWPSSLVLIQRRVPDDDSKVGLATTVTFYDSEAGGNLIQITPDESSLPVLWDLELDTHHSYYFEPSSATCKAIDFPVGILRQDFLKDAEPLGEVENWDGDGTVCGWTKADFIDYYANKETGRPTYWYFHTMKAEFRVLYYEENPDIDPILFVPPDYC